MNDTRLTSGADILMDRIVPSVVTVSMLREGKLHTLDAVSELGIYCAYLRYEATTTT